MTQLQSDGWHHLSCWLNCFNLVISYHTVNTIRSSRPRSAPPAYPFTQVHFEAQRNFSPRSTWDFHTEEDAVNWCKNPALKGQCEWGFCFSLDVSDKNLCSCHRRRCCRGWRGGCHHRRPHSCFLQQVRNNNNNNTHSATSVKQVPSLIW